MGSSIVIVEQNAIIALRVSFKYAIDINVFAQNSFHNKKGFFLFINLSFASFLGWH